MRFLDGETVPAQNGKGPAPARLVLVRKRPMRAVTLVGVVGGLFSLFPLLIAPDPSPVRLACFAVLASASLALVYLGWSRPESVTIAKQPSGLDWGGERLPPPAHVALDGDRTEDPPLYRAVVCWDGGERRVALERDEPGPVLSDALALSKRLGLELRPGWGLERHFSGTSLVEAWQSAVPGEPALGAGNTPSHVEVAVWHAQRRVAGTTFVAGLFVLVSTLVFASSPERSVGPNALEIALPGLAAGFAVALGAILFGLRRRIELSASGVDGSVLLYGIALGPKTSIASGVTRAFAVSPDRGPARHVLFATATGPASVAAHSEGVDWLVERTLHRPASKLTPVERPLATSARYRGPDRPARLRS